MTRHEDCEDGCRLYEHKGYLPCDHTSGVCELLRDEKPDEMYLARDWLIEQDEKEEKK